MTVDNALGPLPDGLLEFLNANDGAEGFVGESYLALWPLARIRELNALLEVQAAAPGLLVVGTNGNLEAYAVDQTGQPPAIVNVPLVGLGYVPTTPIATDLVGLLAWLGGSAIAPASDSSPTKGMLLWEVQPVLFGGSPTDSSNKRLVPLVDGLKMAAWWNHRLHEVSPSRDIHQR